MSIDDKEKAGFLFATLQQYGNLPTENRGQSYVICGEDPEASKKLKLGLGGLFSVSMLNGHYLPPVKIVQRGARILMMTRRFCMRPSFESLSAAG